MIDYIHDLRIGDLIRYNFLYSNEEEKLGIVYKVKKDLNFSAMVYVIGEKTTDVIPYSIMEYKVLDRKN